MSEPTTQPAPSEALIEAEIVEDDRDEDDHDEDDRDEDDRADDEDADDEDYEYDYEYDRGVFVLSEVVERQLIACRRLSTQVTDAATDVTAALVESPVKVLAAVRDGANLPTAFGLTGDALTDSAVEAGSRIRAAVGTYVNSQSALPDALITGVAGVAGSAVRAQGSVASTAFDAAFTLASVAIRGGDVRDSVEVEWEGLSASVVSARVDIEDAIDLAWDELVEALPLSTDAG